MDIAVARRKATDPAARIGSLVINPGGPGGSGVEAAYGAPGSPMSCRSGSTSSGSTLGVWGAATR
ncbi:hypothetical protein GCM10020220_051430 [Nonomuraea rubra]|uniref:hypothetical protein n=1 Tax=Nonomuraea rubra TaxID=46180 RepID=UPI0031E5FD68